MNGIIKYHHKNDQVILLQALINSIVKNIEVDNLKLRQKRADERQKKADEMKKNKEIEMQKWESIISQYAPPGTSLNTIYLNAGKLERMNMLYEALILYTYIITTYPESDIAILANERLNILNKK